MTRAVEEEFGVERGATRRPLKNRAVPLPGGSSLRLRGVPLVMGIINVTPDSFSDGGIHLEAAAAVDAARRMIDDGADLIDIGGESTRPGSLAVDPDTELARVMPVIEGLRRRTAAPISIDTRRAAVAHAAIEAGAGIVNDVSALRHDAGMAAVVRDTGAALILMHMRGEPATMQSDTRYEDLMGEIVGELTTWREAAIASGIDATRLLVDPGIGFGKSFDQNVEILARAGELGPLGPIVIGASRKGFIGHLTGRDPGPARVAGSLAAVAAAALAGAAIVRAHDVRETVDFLRVLEPVLEMRG